MRRINDVIRQHLVPFVDGAALRMYRKTFGVGLREAARQLDISPTYLSRLELNSGRVSPTLETRLRIWLSNLK